MADNRKRVNIPEVRTVVMPTDLSVESLAALGHALFFANQGAEIHLIHVGASAAVLFAQYPSFLPPEDLSGTVKKVAEEELERLVAEWVPEGVKVTQVVRIGTPALEVIDYATAVNADLIIMATQGKSALKHMLLGSTAERVLRGAPCAVLAVKSSGEDVE